MPNLSIVETTIYHIPKLGSHQTTSLTPLLRIEPTGKDCLYQNCLIYPFSNHHQGTESRRRTSGRSIYSLTQNSWQHFELTTSMTEPDFTTTKK